jgi:hypothetical protein
VVLQGILLVGAWHSGSNKHNLGIEEPYNVHNMGIHPSKHKLITFLNIETFQNKILSSAFKLSMSFLIFLHRTIAFIDVQTEEIFIDTAQHTKFTLIVLAFGS